MKKNGFAPLMIILVIAIVGVVVFLLYQNPQIKNQLEQKIPTIPTAPSTESPASDKKIVFSKSSWINPQTYHSEIWTMNTDGTNSKKLNLLQTDTVPINNTSDSWVFYTSPQANPTSGFVVYAFNYLTNKSKQISELSPSGSSVNVDYFSVSPDNKKVLYQVSYTQLVNGSPVCGQESCPDLDLYPGHKTGTYVYNIETDQKTYLGQLGISVVWSTDSKSILYSFTGPEDYHEYKLTAGSYSIDISNGQSSFLGTIKDQVFGFYRLYQINGSQDKIITEVLKNINGGQGDYVIKVDRSGQEKVVDSGNLCITYNCFAISPDSKYAFYLKGSSGIYPNNIMLFDLNKLTIKAILNASTNQNFNLPTWISNSQLVVESIIGSHPNDKHDIILLDVNSGETKSLTNSGDAVL